MRRTKRRRTALALAAPLAIATACSDNLPTLTDADRIPPNLQPVTIEYILAAADVLASSLTARGATTAENSDDLVVALDFDGALDARVLARFEAIPDSIPFETSAETDIIHRGGQVRTIIPDTLSASANELVLSLWTVAEPWDSTTTWTEAVSRPESRPWAEVGGTRGQLLATTTWRRADTTADADSLVWLISPTSMQAFPPDSTPSFLVTMETPDARVEIAPLTFVFSYSPAADPDTTLTRTVPSIKQRFIYSEPEPAPPDLLRAGGVTSDRGLLQLAIPEVLPGCPTGSCLPVPIDEVVLNRVDLILEPVPVTQGFRPLAPIPLRVRRLLEPELGAQAPLGDLVQQVNVAGDLFAGGPTEPIVVIVTGAVAQAIGEKESDLGLALLVEPEASTFPYAWFAPEPQLRFIYTLRQVPELP